MCALTALAGPIHAAQPAIHDSTADFNLASDPLAPYLVNPAVAVEGGVFLPSYSGPPTPRVAVTSNSIQGAQSSAAVASTQTSAATQSPSQYHTGQAQPRGESETSAGGEIHAGARHGGGQGTAKAGPAKTGETGPGVVQPSGKETVTPVAPAETTPFHFAGSLGYYSLYMFRGLDVGYQTGIDKTNKNMGFLGANASASYNDFAMSFWFMNSLDPYVPGGAGYDGSFGQITNGIYKNQLDYHTPQAVRYQEYDLSPSYTFHLTPSLTFTPAMNFYFFSDGRFWANRAAHVNNSEEVGGTFNWTGVKFLNQSLSYFYDFDAFNGGFMEYRVATPPIKLITIGQTAVGLIPSVALSYDFHYNNHASNGWNSVEPGLDIPVKIADGLVVDFGAHYCAPLSNNRADDRYWFTAAFQYTFPNAEPRVEARPEVAESISGKKTVVPLTSEGEETRWHITTGAGIRNLSSSFHVGAAAGYFEGQTGSGDTTLATATHNATYSNGSVLSASNPYHPIRSTTSLGDSDFVVNNSSQVTYSPGNVQQVTFNSYRFNSVGAGFSANDTDSAASPFVSLGYDVYQGKGVSASVGLGYSYARSSMESGVQNTGVSNMLNYQFIYNTDPIWNSSAKINAPFNSVNLNQYSLIYDGKQLISVLTAQQVSGASLFPNLSPQQVVTTTPVAAFRGAQMDTQLNTMSIPIDLTFDLTSRMQARISVGPTLNFFDVDLTTTTDYQQLDSTASGTVEVYANPVTTGGTVVGGAVNVAGASVHGSTPTSIPGPSATKGSNSGATRALPGTNLAHLVNSSNTQKFTVGGFAEVALQLDLDSHKRWFAELYGRFDYVPKFTVADGASTANIDATSFGAGAGFGLRF